ncbi:tripartite tricarboxylate transporter substrate binding protein [Kerstersia gyiorum]|uniref:tripartite tricarboxylate transporter substrate binding protein n=1 Tax=Kerstersia gyiorum TaxID=206506 RepID=UPI003B430A11
MKKAVLASFATLVLLAHGAARADWPEKPIIVTVGFGAGGTTDIVARAVAEVVSRELGQPLVIENKPGAGGAVAATALSRQKPDGYNLVATTSTTITLDPLIAKLGYSADDFSYVAAIGQFPEAYIALPGKGWTTIKDATDAARSAGQLTVASNTALDKMLTRYIAKQDGVNLKPVPTRSGAEVVTQVMGGHLDLGYSSGAYYPQAENGDVVVLAALADERISGLPDVPTLKEQGYDVSSVNLVMFVAPKGLPADIQAKLTAAFDAAGRNPNVLALLKRRSVDPVVLSGAALEQTVDAHIAGYRQLIDATSGD